MHPRAAPGADREPGRLLLSATHSAWRPEMPYVVTDNCQDCRFTDCVEVCPVDCFYGDARMLYIHPDECIDCGACEPACPVEAIFAEDDLPADKESWLQLNADKCEEDDIQHITESQDPLPTAEEKKARLGL
jgi:ferredoxin